MAPLRWLAAAALPAAAAAYDNGAPNSRLPPLGWSSWEAFGPGTQHPVRDYCDTNSVMAAADAFFETGLYAAGYRHMHLDDCWSIAERNASGFIQPDHHRFPPTSGPNASDGSGMKTLIAYLHSKNLTFGLCECHPPPPFPDLPSSASPTPRGRGQTPVPGSTPACARAVGLAGTGSRTRRHLPSGGWTGLRWTGAAAATSSARVSARPRPLLAAAEQ